MNNYLFELIDIIDEYNEWVDGKDNRLIQDYLDNHVFPKMNKLDIKHKKPLNFYCRCITLNKNRFLAIDNKGLGK